MKTRYLEYIQKVLQLENKVDMAENELMKIVRETDSVGMGLVSDELRTSSEYQKADKIFTLAFKELQSFNRNSPKAFMKKRSLNKRICNEIG